jgi:hypothetical protein
MKYILGYTGHVPPGETKNLLEHAEQATMKDDKFVGLYRRHPTVKNKMFTLCKGNVKYNSLVQTKKSVEENGTHPFTKDENYWSM